jgi:hypothetical protein
MTCMVSTGSCWITQSAFAPTNSSHNHNDTVDAAVGGKGDARVEL